MITFHVIIASTYLCNNSDTFNFLKLSSIKFLLICKSYLGKSAMIIKIAVLKKYHNLWHPVPKVVTIKNKHVKLKALPNKLC